MPYIDKSKRSEVEPTSQRSAQTEGELNYQITQLCQRFVEEHALDFRKSYKTINAVVGVLECAKLELYRRMAAPYEDHMKTVHGDVYR